MTRFGLFALAALLLAIPAAAQPAAPDAENGRFTFHPIENGYLRLDGRTGQVSTCARERSVWQCQAVPDDRAALEAEIARLQGDNSALKKELLSHNLPRGAQPREVAPEAGTDSKTEPDAKSETQRNTEPKTERKESDSATRNEPTLRMPSDAEINQMMTFLEKVWRRLVEMIMNAQKDLMRKT
jgi:hypothetical protein